MISEVDTADDEEAISLKAINKDLEFINNLDLKPSVWKWRRGENVDLPVSMQEWEILEAVNNNLVTILCGETGSGKSTQVP